MSGTLPSTRDIITRLIASPSVSCVTPDLDMSNRGVIDLAAESSESLGFDVEIQAVDEDKFNMIARAGRFFPQRSGHP